MHVVLDAPYPAHFFTTARTTWSAVDEVGQRRAVPGRFRGTMAINDHHATVIGGRSQHQLARNSIVVGDDGAGQAAFAQA